jgi:pimeloyl-ACP methyl ester carboxylesterase
MIMNTQYFEQSEGTIAYDDSQGDGELVLMLPGMGALRSEYRYLAPALIEAGYRVVTADLRGHGESSVDWPEYTLPAAGQDILDLIAYLDAGPAHVIGTSFSPGAAVWAAVEKPEAVRSLTMIGPWVRDAPANAVKDALTAVLLSGPWKVWGWTTFYKTLYPTRQPDDFDEYLGKLKSNLREPGRFDALKGLGFTPKTASEERLSQVHAPVLVVMGSKDPDWPSAEDEANWIVEQVSGELLLVEDAGHYPQTEMPSNVIPSVLDFLKRKSALAGPMRSQAQSG